MKNLDESKYPLELIFECQKASDNTERLLLTFHENLTDKLNKENLDWSARTHKIGISYVIGNKAFIWAIVCQDFVSVKFFTGNSSITGLKKANWIYKNDRKGSETFRIYDSFSLKQALEFSLKAYEITTDWTK